MERYETHIKKFDELTVQELHDIYKARETVFILEQKCVFLDADDADPRSCHIWLTDDSGILSYLRVSEKGAYYDEVTIGRVLSIKRNCGYGKAVFAEGMRYAIEEMHADKIRLKSELYIKGFYEKFGFRQVTEPFLTSNILHIEMLWEA